MFLIAYLPHIFGVIDVEVSLQPLLMSPLCVLVASTHDLENVFCSVNMHEIHDKYCTIVKRFQIVLMPKDPAVLQLKSLKHSIWNTLVPHPQSLHSFTVPQTDS